MKALPFEGRAQKTKSKARYRAGMIQGNTSLAKYSGKLKKITLRLREFAEHDLDDREVKRLLDDTREQVLQLHLVRRKMRKKK